MFLLLLLIQMLGTARAEGESPSSTGKWQQVVLQQANRTLHDDCQDIWQWEHLLPRGSTKVDSA